MMYNMYEVTIAKDYKLQWNRSFGTPLIREHRVWSPKNVITSSLYLSPILNGHLH